MTQPKTASKFTPGPWSYDRHLFRADESGYEHESYSICATSGAPYIGSVNKGQECGSAEAQANARLIAAAPEMYELLRHILTADGVPQSTAAGPMSRKDIAWLKTVYAEARRIKAAVDGED